MTERLYYAEPYRTEFEATVERVEHADGRTLVTLDRTAFYPASGGQPFDTGTLGEVRVVEVVDREDGSIAHVIDGELAVGHAVRGRIDWARRFDHMQQHTGQHVLSAAFDRLFGARTESFHLGAAASTIDLSRELPADAIGAAESEANRVVWDDRPVSIRFADAEEAAKLALRKEPARGGRLRLIEIEDCDLSACGGTHVSRTGAIGIITVSSWERFRGGIRVEFLCGGRVLTAFRQLKDAVSGSVRVLSVLPGELPAAIERVQSESKDLKRTIKALQERLASHEAAALASRGTVLSGRTVVVESLDGWDAAGLKSLASAIAEKPGHAVALFSTTTPVLVVIARSKDVDLDAGAVLRGLTARFGGRGGGKPDLAQGGGFAGAIPELLAAARELLQGRGLLQ